MLSMPDYALLGVLLLSGLLGALRGLVAEVLSLVVWIAAFWLAFVYGAEVAKLFTAQAHDPAARLFIAYALVFIAAMIVGSMVTWMVGKLVRSIGLGGVDRLLGLLFGLLRGAALGCVLVLVLGFTTLPQETSWRASTLIPQFQRGAEWMKAWLPAAVAEHVTYAPTRPASVVRRK
jgi:membrane protein required for colicin V production